jgi:hypothetical protein
MNRKITLGIFCLFIFLGNIVIAQDDSKRNDPPAKTSTGPNMGIVVTKAGIDYEMRHKKDLLLIYVSATAYDISSVGIGKVTVIDSKRTKKYENLVFEGGYFRVPVGMEEIKGTVVLETSINTITQSVEWKL